MSGGIYTEWWDLFPRATVRKLPREISDHNPLVVYSGHSQKLSHIQFKFELSWISNPDFIQGVGRLWGKPCYAKSPLDKIQQKLKLVKQYFKGWGFNLQGIYKKKRKIIQDELGVLEEKEESGGLQPHQIERKMHLLAENLSQLQQEESYWYNRSHETWLLKGDNSRSYFHKCANGH